MPTTPDNWRERVARRLDLPRTTSWPDLLDSLDARLPLSGATVSVTADQMRERAQNAHPTLAKQIIEGINIAVTQRADVGESSLTFFFPMELPTPVTDLLKGHYEKQGFRTGLLPKGSAFVPGGAILLGW